MSLQTLKNWKKHEGYLDWGVDHVFILFVELVIFRELAKNWNSLGELL